MKEAKCPVCGKTIHGPYDDERCYDIPNGYRVHCDCGASLVMRYTGGGRVAFVLYRGEDDAALLKDYMKRLLEVMRPHLELPTAVELRGAVYAALTDAADKADAFAESSEAKPLQPTEEDVLRAALNAKANESLLEAANRQRREIVELQTALASLRLGA